MNNPKVIATIAIAAFLMAAIGLLMLAGRVGNLTKRVTVLESK